MTEYSDNEIIIEDDYEDNDEDNNVGDGGNVAADDRTYEVVIVEETVDQPAAQGCTTRSGCLSKPCDHATHFPEKAHM